MLGLVYVSNEITTLYPRIKIVSTALRHGRMEINIF